MSKADLGAQGYRLKVGKWSNRRTLLNFMQRAYQELCPSASLTHFSETIDELWSEQTHLWLAEKAEFPEAVGCLWIGSAVDPLSGREYPHIFLLYVVPDCRRQGLGTALMQHAESWAAQQGYRQLGLNVFVENTPALSLYKRLGYRSQSLILQKDLYHS